jgi:hypothetical protein
MCTAPNRANPAIPHLDIVAIRRWSDGDVPSNCRTQLSPALHELGGSCKSCRWRCVDSPWAGARPPIAYQPRRIQPIVIDDDEDRGGAGPLEHPAYVLTEQTMTKSRSLKRTVTTIHTPANT